LGLFILTFFIAMLGNLIALIQSLLGFSSEE